MSPTRDHPFHSGTIVPGSGDVDGDAEDVDGPRYDVGAMIRPARPDDHAAIARLYLELAVPDAPPTAAEFAADFLGQSLVDDDAGRLRGYVLWGTAPPLAHVRHLVVAPEDRARGVGRALLCAAAVSLRALGCARWWLTVKPDNDAAIGLYERMGMVGGEATRVLRLVAAPVPSAGADVVDAPADEDAVHAAQLGIGVKALTAARARPGVVAFALRRSGGVLGWAAVDPKPPVVTLLIGEDDDDRTTLLARCAATNAASPLKVRVDGPATERYLVDRGAVHHLAMMEMRGELPTT